MSTSWLANADPTSSWAHFAWSDFAALGAGNRTLAVLPVHGLADHGLGLPLDAEEAVGSAVLRRAVTALAGHASLRVLPPLRFGLAPYPSTFFGIDPETAHELIESIAASVKAAGIERLVFFNTSPWNEEFIAAASCDSRASLGLHTFIVNLSGLGLDFHPTSPARGAAQAVAAHVLGTPPAPAVRLADIRDEAFRPGQLRQPAPLAFTGSIDGHQQLVTSAARLAGLLAEIGAQPAPGTASAATATPVIPTVISDPESEAVWPSHRARYLGAFTRDALEALPDKDKALVILPTGAIEQHGHHLPVGVDAILGQAWLHHTLPLLSPDAPVYVAPPITFGKSNEHTGFAGTVSITARVLRRLVLASAAQLRALGFKRIAILNTHGGNSAVLVYTVRELQDGTAFQAGLLSGHYRPAQDAQEAAYGFHAGEWETSLMLACSPELVRMDRAVCEYPAYVEAPGELRPENAPAVFSWLTKDVSVSGVMGDATRASTEKGIRWMTEASLALAQHIERISH
ncbi:hypothetical protein MASR2M8_13020 [Opitutaceae bacterium]